MSKDYDRKMGLYYGFPLCCINFYVKNATKTYWYNRYENKYPKAMNNGDGFIPCEKHLKMIEKGVIKREDLIKNRKCPIEYPNGGKIDSYKVTEIINSLTDVEKNILEFCLKEELKNI